MHQARLVICMCMLFSLAHVQRNAPTLHICYHQSAFKLHIAHEKINTHTLHSQVCCCLHTNPTLLKHDFRILHICLARTGWLRCWWSSHDTFLLLSTRLGLATDKPMCTYYYIYLAQDKTSPGKRSNHKPLYI